MSNFSLIKKNRLMFPSVYTNSSLQLFCLLVLLGSLVVACEPRFDKDLLEKLVKMDNPVYKGKPVSEEAISTIRVIVNEYHAYKEQEKQSADGEPKKQAEYRMNFVEKMSMLYYRLGVDYLEIDQLRQQEISQAEANGFAEGGPENMPLDEVLVYQSALAIRLMAKGMYLNALSCLESILKVFPDNERLFYYAGLCAANLGKACLTDELAAARAGWYEKAYSYYSQANILKTDYPEAEYALAVLLIYELDRQDEAEPWLLKLLAQEKNNVKAYFMLGSLYFKQNRLEEALKQYQAAKDFAADETTKAQAEDNISKVNGALNGQ